ncbi:MAG: S41 family peptidase, partial [Calditrichaceae bacterium]
PVDYDDKFDYSDEFQTVWQDFDLNYSYFTYKQINWDSLKSVYQPLVEEEVTYNYFITSVLAPMLTELRDIHVRLYFSNGNQVQLYSRPAVVNFDYTDQFYSKYISDINQTSGKVFTWGSIADSIGYLLISNWINSADTEEFLNTFDSHKDAFNRFKAFLIDVRPNGGGNELLAQNIAGRFIEHTETYAYRKVRNGPNHDDFSAFSSNDISPAGTWQFIKPVALLIGQGCVSSNEAFVLMMMTQDHVTSIGDTTRGASGNPGVFNLEDGTEYHLSRWVAYKTDQTILEDVGIFPDIAIPASQSIVGDRDMVLEKAIELLR